MTTAARADAAVAVGFDTASAWWRPEQKAFSQVVCGPGGRLAFAALVTFTVILLLSPQIWFPVLGTLRIALLAAGVAIGAHVLDCTVRHQPITPVSGEIMLALALVAWSIVTIPVSYWPGGSLSVLTEHYLKAVAFFWLLGTVVNTPRRLRVMAWALVICAVPLAATGLKNYFTGMVLSTGVPGLKRIYGYAGGSGLVGNPNDLALMLNLIIPIAGAVALNTERRATRAFAIAAIILSATTVIVTFSRAGFLTLAVTFLMFLVVLARRRRSPGTAAGLLVIALVMLPLLPSGYTERLSTIADLDADATGSAQGRWKDVQVAAGVVAANPIVGVGLGQDILAMNEYRGRGWTRVHNAYLEAAVDLGLPGFVLFAWLHVACFRSARRVERASANRTELRDLAHLATGVQIALIAFGVAALFHPIAYQFYFFTVGGLAVALENAYRTESGAMRPAAPSTA